MIDDTVTCPNCISRDKSLKRKETKKIAGYVYYFILKMKCIVCGCASTLKSISTFDYEKTKPLGTARDEK